MVENNDILNTNCVYINIQIRYKMITVLCFRRCNLKILHNYKHINTYSDPLRTVFILFIILLLRYFIKVDLKLLIWLVY